MEFPSSYRHHFTDGACILPPSVPFLYDKPFCQQQLYFPVFMFCSLFPSDKQKLKHLRICGFVPLGGGFSVNICSSKVLSFNLIPAQPSFMQLYLCVQTYANKDSEKEWHNLSQEREKSELFVISLLHL